MPAPRTSQSRPTAALPAISRAEANRIVDGLPAYRAYLQRSTRIKPEPQDESIPEDCHLPAGTSHTRKRDEGHIPRPRNRFLLFRSDLCTSKKIITAVGSHYGELSRVAADVWNKLSEDRKDVYEKLAAEEKEEHKRKHPNYKYAPSQKHNTVKRKKKLGADGKKRKNTVQKTSVKAKVTSLPRSVASSKKRVSTKKSVIHRKSGKASLRAVPSSKAVSLPCPAHKLIKKEFQEITLDEAAENASVRFKTRLRSKSLSIESEDPDDHSKAADECLSALDTSACEASPDPALPFNLDGTINPSAIFDPEAVPAISYNHASYPPRSSTEPRHFNTSSPSISSDVYNDTQSFEDDDFSRAGASGIDIESFEGEFWYDITQANAFSLSGYDTALLDEIYAEELMNEFTNINNS